MQIEPLHELTIVRSGGFTGTTDKVTVSRDLVARVNGGREAEHRFPLDGRESEILLHSLDRMAREKSQGSTVTGFDLFHYDIELHWNGTTHRVQSVDLGADEALHGVMMVANDLIARAASSEPLALR